MTRGFVPDLPSSFPNKGEIYKHYKGDMYEVIGLAIHSDDDVWMVVYKPLYENADAEMFVLSLDRWNEVVTWNEQEVRRFLIVNE